MSRFIDLTLNGVSNGAIYAAVAIAFVLIWRATRIVNFAQGGLLMVTTFIAFSVEQATGSYWAAFFVALASGLMLGAVVERLLLRRVEGGPPLNAVIAVAGMALLLALLFRATNIGLTLRAAAFEPEVARLQGVRVSRMLTLGWALASMAGSLAGLLIAPAVFVGPNNFDPVTVFGFTAAVLGGLDSPVGALVGGLVLGVSLSYVAGYAGSSLVTLAALAILIAVLMVRPSGLFTSTRARRI